MADNASIARPYAKAVFELAQESDSFDAWGKGIEKLSLISQDAEFSALVSDPRVDKQNIEKLLLDLCSDALPAGGENLIKLVISNDRLDALSDIHQQYGELVAKAQQSVTAQVVTAKALTDDQRSSLESALQTRLGLKVSLQETIDESLLGGAIVKAGDLVIDGSAQGRLNKLNSHLMR